MSITAVGQEKNQSVILTLTSNLSFETLSLIYSRSTRPLKIIDTYFHWGSSDHPEFTKKNLKNNQEVFVCDDSFTWAPIHDKSGLEHTLYAVTCSVFNPLCLMEQYEDYETIFHDREKNPRKNVRLLRKDNRHSAIVWTPHVAAQSSRQMAILQPQRDIITIQNLGRGTFDDEHRFVESQSNNKV